MSRAQIVTIEKRKMYLVSRDNHACDSLSLPITITSTVKYLNRHLASSRPFNSANKVIFLLPFIITYYQGHQKQGPREHLQRYRSSNVFKQENK